jgi:hypothetical protein
LVGVEVEILAEFRPTKPLVTLPGQEAFSLGLASGASCDLTQRVVCRADLGLRQSLAKRHGEGAAQ